MAVILYHDIVMSGVYWLFSVSLCYFSKSNLIISCLGCLLLLQ